MQATLPAPLSTLALRTLNAAASVAVVWLACGLYLLLPFHQGDLQRLHGLAPWALTGRDFLIGAALAYSALVTAWMALEPAPGRSKSLRFLSLLARLARAPRETWRQPLESADRVALLTTLLKAFFGPLMVLALFSFCMAAWVNAQGILIYAEAGASVRTLFNRHGFWFCLQLILFVDVLVFTLGYLIESRRLGNEIRSVDPTWLGWLAALLCYPPFNTYTAMVLGAQNVDFPQFADPTVHLLANSVLLLLMAIYASASVALGMKASNLTHRGVIARGPYAFVRHPAYVCKNIAWWIGAAPLVGLAFERGLGSGLMALASVAGWSLLYVLRALTEEDHLRRVDGEYAQYAARVRWRFIPGLW